MDPFDRRCMTRIINDIFTSELTKKTNLKLFDNGTLTIVDEATYEKNIVHNMRIHISKY